MTYIGGKNGSGTYQAIINEFPPHDVYIEAFLGSGAVYLKKLAARISFLIDLVPLEFLPCKNAIRPGDLFLNLDAIGFIENSCSILNFLDASGFKVLMYLDPPYPINARSCQVKMYEFEMTDQDHIRLLSVLRSLNFFVAISSYENEIYDEMLLDWRKKTFNSMTRAGLRKEVLYMNYQVPEKLHDYRYLGNSFRQRELVKSMRSNFLKKLKNLDPQYRNAVLHDVSCKILNIDHVE